MPGCAAIGCSNSSRKGFLMIHFPTNPARRKEWAVKLRRDKWEPTKYTCICEVHFEPTMWEKPRVDGKRKLKSNAVPTLFSFTKPQKTKRKSPKLRQSQNLNIPSTSAAQETIPILKSSSSSSISSITNEDIKGVKVSKTVEEKMNQYNKEYKKALMKVRSYKEKLRKTVKQLKVAQKEENENSKLLHSMFSDDQIIAMKRKSTRFMKWSNLTITKALKLKFSCGSNGYEELIKQKIPLPSLRTLRRRLQMLKFDSGILQEVIQFMKIKVDLFKNNFEKDCVLLMDEMAITPSLAYDVALNKYFGKVTLPEHEGDATHILVFMLGGISSRWKQTIAYYFTGNSVNGSTFQKIIFQIVKEVESIGLKVISLTSDMGSCNQALWKLWNIKSGRYSNTSNFIQHPFDVERKIFVIADVPHLFKNIKNTFVSNEIITFSAEIQAKHNLPTNLINIKHIHDLINYQSSLTFKLAPRLHEEDLLPNHYDKMKVGKSANVISHDVSSALKFLAEKLNKPEYITTAWFIDLIEKWFKLMTSRHPILALSTMNAENYENSISFLKDFMYILQELNFGEKAFWKPSQSGALISTQSILDLQKIYLIDKGFHFLLTSRFTQDCLENLFSILRSKQVIPNALQAKNNLKIITVCQYLRDVSKGSYDEDERQFLSGFLDIISSASDNQQEQQTSIIPEVKENISLNMNIGELNSFYNVCGYIMNSIIKNSKTCDKCVDSVGSKRQLSYKFTTFCQLKAFKRNCLFYCSEQTFMHFLDLEAIFRNYSNKINQISNLKEFYISKISEECNVFSFVPNCHNLNLKIIKRFVIFRLKIFGKRKIVKINKYASKSVGIRI